MTHEQLRNIENARMSIDNMKMELLRGIKDDPLKNAPSKFQISLYKILNIAENALEILALQSIDAGEQLELSFDGTAGAR